MDMPVQQVLINSVEIFFQVITWLILARVILSWLPIGKDNFIAKLIYALTEPLLGPVRKMIFKSPLGGQGMMLDFSPVIVILLSGIVRAALIQFIGSM